MFLGCNSVTLNASQFQEANLKETQWPYKLFSFYPAGLNIREETKL